jgi:hypothetical protein
MYLHERNKENVGALGKVMFLAFVAAVLMVAFPDVSFAVGGLERAEESLSNSRNFLEGNAVLITGLGIAFALIRKFGMGAGWGEVITICVVSIGLGSVFELGEFLTGLGG